MQIRGLLWSTVVSGLSGALVFAMPANARQNARVGHGKVVPRRHVVRAHVRRGARLPMVSPSGDGWNAAAGWNSAGDDWG
jgi:hypothetical protein